MPVKLNSRLPADAGHEARIEIVPLIDIMFFLLASFMLVSLSMVNLKTLKMNLPAAASATSDTTGKNFVDISVDQAGLAYLDKRPMDDVSLLTRLAANERANPKMRVFISGDRDARHGDMIRVLDLVRRAGVSQVSFEISPGAKALSKSTNSVQGALANP